MKKGFSLLNIVILLSLFFLTFLLYDKYNKNFSINNSKQNSKDKPEVLDQNLKSESNSTSTETEKIQKKSSPLPDPNTLPSLVPNKTNSPIVTDNKAIAAHNGFYTNEIYNYTIHFPSSWTLKNQYPNNVSIGTIPPKDGQGVLTIIVGNSGESEINQLKNEVKKYPGLLELREEKIVIDNVESKKIILINNIIKSKTVYIMLSKNNNNFMIQYGVESDEFSKQIDNILREFKFI